MPRPRPASDSIRYERLFGAPVRVAEYPRPMLSDEVETAQTIHMMDELAEADAAHRLVIDATGRALDQAGINLSASAKDKATAVYWFLKRTIRYVPTPGTSPLVDQTLIPPASLLSMPDPEGDCPQFSMLASAMLRVCCVRCLFKTIAADPDFPDTYTHVYNVVEVGANQFMPFDSSNGPAPGAEYGQRIKERVWPQVKRMKCDPAIATRHRCDAAANFQPRRVTKGMGMVQNYRRNPSNRNAVLRRGLRGHIFYPLQGLGDLQCDQDNNCYDTATGQFSTPASPIDLSQYTTPGDSVAAYGGPASYPSPLVTTNPAYTGSPTAALVASLAADATQIAAPLVRAAAQQAPYFVTNPATGQSVLYNPNTGTTGAATGIAASLSSLSPTTILIGLALVGAFAFSRK